MSKNGSDWEFVRFLTMKRGKLLEDTLNYVKYGDLTWYKVGVFYYRYDVKNTDVSFKGTLENHSIYYHKMGTSQSSDKLVYENKFLDDVHFQFFPDNNFVVKHYSITHGAKKYYIVSMSELNDNALHLFFKDILTSTQDSVHFNVIGKLNNKLIIESNLGAPNGGLYKLNPLTPNRLEGFIAQYDEQLNYSTIMRDRIVCAYTNDSTPYIVVFDSTGKELNLKRLPRNHALGEFSANATDSILIFSFHSFITPSIMYTLNINSYKTDFISTTEIHFKFEDLITRKVYYKSKDGTTIPMYLSYKKGLKLNGQNPVILYGYGGFGVKMEPFFSAANIIFLRNGGIFAAPCLRGGGDYPGWHEQGERLKKQNTFDDFIAAAEYLISSNYTCKDKIAAMGGSNGGLLVGAVMLQRPDLFKVVVSSAGVFDMMRYHYFNTAYHWRQEYGDVFDSSDFKNLLSYSPVHNVKKGIVYPATLLVTGDNDDRVNPFHTYKFLATLQASAPCINPYVLFVEKKAGHLQSGNFEKRENTDAVIYSFIFKYLGMEKKMNYDNLGE